MDRVLQSLGKVVGGYIRGQAITSLSIALFTLVVLLAVDVPNAIAFAVLAAFVDIIPIVGAVIAIFFPTLVAFRESTTQAIIVMVALVAYQQFEDRVLVPRVYGQTLNLPPIVVLIAVLVGGRLFGIPGVLLALPSTAIARIALDYFMEKRQLPGLPEVPMEPENQPLAPDNEEPAEEPSGEQTRSR